MLSFKDCDITASKEEKGVPKGLLGDANTVVKASLAATKRLRCSNISDLPCQVSLTNFFLQNFQVYVKVCGKLSRSSAVTRGNNPNVTSNEMNNYSGLEVLGDANNPEVKTSVVVCEACKKFCSRFSSRLNDENEEWKTKCACRNMASKLTSQSGSSMGLLERNLADMCRWCRFRRCHSLGLVVKNEEKAKLKESIDIHSVPCAICSASSSGYHFGVITCEGCKGFFRRTTQQKMANNYVCEGNGANTGLCDVTSQAGRRCKKCRFDKCLSLGMSLAAVRTGRHSYQRRAETRAHLEQLNNGSIKPEPQDVQESLRPQPIQQPQQSTAPLLNTFTGPEYNLQPFEPSPPSSFIDTQCLFDDTFFTNTPEAPRALLECSSDDDDFGISHSKRGKWENNSSEESSLSDTFNERAFLDSPPFTSNSTDAYSDRNLSPDLGSNGAGSPIARESVQDAITRMKKPCEKSPYVWLYDSGKEYIDLREPNPKLTCANSLSKYEKDPLHLLNDYFFVTPISATENLTASHLPMIDASRCQWLIRRVVQSSRLVGNITTVRAAVRPEMGPTEVFSSMVNCFDLFSRCVLQFVKSLPGFDSINLGDRTKLFLEGLFPLLSAQLSLDFDETTQTPNMLGLEPGPGRQVAFRYFYHLGMAEPSMTDAGISIKQARLCVIEFAMVCGLLYFNPDVEGLQEPHRVKRIADEYKRAAEIFIGRNFAMNGSQSAQSRINMFYSQLNYFRSFYRFFSWMLCDFGREHGQLVNSDPWLTELHDKYKEKIDVSNNIELTAA